MLSAVATLLFVGLVSSEPANHKLITAHELKIINDGRTNADYKPPVPWRAILTSPAVLALIASRVGIVWALFMSGARRPTYMDEVLHVSHTAVSTIYELMQ